MAAMLAATMLVAIAALAYGVYKAGECDALNLEVACLRRSVEKWADAYYDVIRYEGSDGENP